MKDFETKLKSAFQEVFQESEITKDFSQKMNLEWDSINHLNLIIAIESKFDLFFEPNEIAEMRDYKKVEEILLKKIRGEKGEDGRETI